MIRPPRWRWKDPQGALGSEEASPQRAAKAAILAALSAAPGARLDVETRKRLWRSLKARGWSLEEVRP